MDKIRCICNREVNYACHILSVARCGYDNAYGEKYRGLYEAEDLAALKKYEKDLTIAGGEHCGELLWIIAGICQSRNAGELCDITLKQIRNDEFHLPAYDSRRKESVIEILELFRKYYDYYVREIWPGERERLEKSAAQIQEAFSQMGFAEKAEELVGETADMEFMPSLVLSVEGGAEAIFIGDQEDIFGAERDLMSSITFIGHEYIIFLLNKAVPPRENEWLDARLYDIREGLAEFYLQKLLGNTGSFGEQQKYIDFYKNKTKEKPYTAKQLYEYALEL